MSFPRYTTYKRSEAGWVLDVPEHWKILPCRGFVDERTEKNEDAACQSYLSLMANVGVIPYEEKGDIGNKKPEDLSKCKIVQRGDFVINSMNYGIGSYGVSAYDGVCSPVYIVLAPRPEVVEPRFAFRVFEDKSFQSYAQSFGNGILAHRCAIGWDDLKGVAVGVPPAAEQKSILNFLDRETAKIDALIAEQQRLIEILQEKRQAVISHAVTKGLNPNAPMKYSGVEWLGEVPEHWGVAQLKHFSKSLPGFAFPSERFSQDESKWRLLRGVNVGVSCIRWDETVYWDREADDRLDQYVLEPGDLVVGLDRPMIKEGLRVARVSLDDCPCMLLQRVAAVKGTASISTDYLFYLLSSTFFAAHFEPETTGVSVPHISTKQIDSFVVPIPSLEEQNAALVFLAEELDGTRRLIQEAEKSIELLQERRSALISAAVTGQIDVRGLVKEEEP
jgi:type I restriction enzyme S subunit